MRDLELRHYQEFETQYEETELAAQLMIRTHNNREQLAARGIYGPLDRYGRSVEASVAAVQRGKEQADPDHYALVNKAGNVVGAGTVFRSLELKWLSLPLPRKAIPHRLRHTILPPNSPNITAWIDESEADSLSLAYSALVDRAHHETARDCDSTAWTLEPVDSPIFVLRAIESSQLARAGASRRYDDAENFTNAIGVPSRGPMRALYTAQLHR